MTTCFTADIASYQHGLLLAALRPDCVAVQIKCTEGASYVNPDYAGWLPQAKAAQLLTVAYHYVTGDDPAAQARNLAAHIGDRGLPVMLDVEQGSGNLPHVMEVADAMTVAGLNVRLVYLPEFYWAQGGRPDLAGPLGSRHLSLISAHYPTMATGTPAGLYPGDTSPLWAPCGGVTPAMLQFTSAALEGGKKVDMNAFRGSPAQLATLLGVGTPEQPGPTAHPAPAFPGRTLTYRAGGVQIHGDDVRTWQARMAWRGWRVTVDGWYGQQSAAVCTAFQQDSSAHGWPLVADGQVGHRTWAAAWDRPVSR